ncbi:hypothetical protein PIB30_087980, partial [Stylosanthes scabra]|nr:hypothetical protein [Stylosanthes scabra]
LTATEELPRWRWNSNGEIGETDTAEMEMELSPRETNETVGDVETRISTEKNYEDREHVAQCTTKVRNSKIGAEFEKTEVKNGNRTPKNLGKGPTRCDPSAAT